MTDPALARFEARFAARLADYASIPVRPVDASEIARSVTVRPRSRVPSLEWVVPRVPAVAWVLLALAMAAAAALLVGAWIEQRHPGPARLVLALEDGLYLADRTGEDRRRIRADGSFLLPAWSSDGGTIAVLHGPPVPGQPGASGQPRTAVPFSLVGDELLILDGDGRTIASVNGPFIGLRWAPASPNATPHLAARRIDGSVVVVDSTGGILLDRGLTDPVPADDATLLQPGVEWLTPDTLLVAAGHEVERIDLSAPGVARPVVRVESGTVNDIALAPDGRSLAFVMGSCRSGCTGEARVARVEASPPSGPSAPAGRGLLARLSASAALSWAPDGRHVLAWPDVADNEGGLVTRVPGSSVLGSRDVVAAWTRYARDGSRDILAFDGYPYFNDRHFDVWLVTPDGTATRIAVRTLGADLRPAPQGNDAHTAADVGHG